MNDLDAIWEQERRCWVDGKSYYREIITEDSVYAFPPPMGIFKGSDFVDSMGEEGPCVSVEFTNKNSREFNDTYVLVYEGIGKSADGSLRKSNCTTVWQRSENGWKLAVHHQTPLND